MKAISAVSVAVIVVVGTSYVWRSRGPTFGAATSNLAVAADSSERLSTLSPPKDEDADHAEEVALDDLVEPVG